MRRALPLIALFALAALLGASAVLAAPCADGSAILPLVEVRREVDAGGALVDVYRWGPEQCQAPPPATRFPTAQPQPTPAYPERMRLPLVFR
jgi:hypothetical protein